MCIRDRTYSHLGKPDSADYYLRKFEEIIEITGKESVAKQTSELETKYQTAKKDNEILEQKSKIFKKNVTLLSLLGLLVAAGITFFSLFRHCLLYTSNLRIVKLNRFHFF